MYVYVLIYYLCLKPEMSKRQTIKDEVLIRQWETREGNTFCNKEKETNIRQARGGEGRLCISLVWKSMCIVCIRQSATTQLHT